MKPHDEFFSREDRYSLGVDEESGVRYASFPVSNGIADYEEYYKLSDDQYAQYMADRAEAVAFVEACRRREHDGILMQNPGWNRGVPI